MGLMQLMPQTARQYQARNPYDPASNIEAGTRHLKKLLGEFELPLALAAYNAGEAAVRRFGGIPPYAETQTYVARILGLLGSRVYRAGQGSAEAGLRTTWANCYNFRHLAWNFAAGWSRLLARLSRAPTRQKARRAFATTSRTQGLHVLSLRKRNVLGGGSILLKRRKVARHEFLVFNQEFATLLKAGMPLVQSIDLLRHQVVNPVFRGVLDDVHEKVRGGTALSEAFAGHGDLFPRVYTASLLAGERSGNLDAILRRYVVYEKVIDTVRRKTISALIYPVILVVLAIALVSDHRAQGRAGVQRLLRGVQRRTAAVDPDHSGGFRTSRSSSFC